jgi:nitrite reductase (cytochrome c-552)
MPLGGGDLIRGFEAMNPMKYQNARKLVTHPVSWIDGHDSSRMQLRMTRPGFLEGIQKVKAAQGVQNYDVSRDATRQEMGCILAEYCRAELALILR